MDDKFLTAVVASGAALLTVLLKNWYDQRNNERNALRDYEYEARKRLYQTYEPLFFQLSELSEIARGRIKGVAKSLSEGSYKGEWENFSNYYFRETIYKIFIPVAIVKLIRDKITSTDLRIDEKLSCQYGLLKILYFSFQQDYKIARIIEDKKYDEEWIKNYRTDNANIHRQGLSLTELDKFLKLFEKENNGIYSVIDIIDYEDVINDEKDIKKERSIRLVEKVFKNFNLETHKIIWILLLAHACIYHIISETKTNQHLNKQIIFQHINNFFKNKVADYTTSNNEIENQFYANGAERYIREQIEKRIKLNK